MRKENADLLDWIRPENWISLHVFYHTGDRSELAVRLIRPTIADLLRCGSIEAFFFVRYSLGGPHVRLRLLPRPGKREDVRALVRRRSEEFLTAYPSPRALPDEEVRKQNLRLLRQDPNEQDEAIYPDNSCCEIPYRPEIERYGGSDLFAYSIFFFALSSSRVLELLSKRSESQPEWLATALGLLRRFAIGFSVDTEELQALAGVPMVANPEVTARIISKADRVFGKNQEQFLRVLRQDIERLSLATTHFDDFEMATRLSRKLRGAAAPIRHRILTSHLHMTANRLGLRNSDEIYLMRMLGRSLTTIAVTQPWWWSELQQALARRATGDDAPATRLRDLLRPTFADILTQPGDREEPEAFSLQ